MYIEYIISFLLGTGQEEFGKLISYGSKQSAQIIIEPSGFFDDDVYLTEKSLPTLPLSELDGVPILFGDDKVWEENGQLHIGADLIASTFFFLTRYEECVRRDVRDQHGRFIGKESLPYRAGFLNRPVVEGYGHLLRKYLRQMGVSVQEPAPGFQHIYLTHDVDEIWTWDNYYRALRSTAKRILTNQPNKLQPLLACHNYQKYDPAYTFPWLMEQDNRVRVVCGHKQCTPVYFFMGCTEKRYFDKGYMANRTRTGDLIHVIQGAGAVVGYHVSYAASLTTEEIAPEIDRIAKLNGKQIIWSRNHYLASREPEDFRVLIDAGITDDFTMGYADVAGFRLGTCRPVRWIDPVKRELTPLTLHPMTVMECTLDGADYMALQNEDEAFAYAADLLQKCYAYAGEAVLLWHNTSVTPSPHSYQRSLYQRLLTFLRDMY